MGKLTLLQWCDEMAAWYVTHGSDERMTPAFRIAAAALRWYAKTETGGDDHAERQAMIAACKEATSE